MDLFPTKDAFREQCWYLWSPKNRKCGIRSANNINKWLTREVTMLKIRSTEGKSSSSKISFLGLKSVSRKLLWRLNQTKSKCRQSRAEMRAESPFCPRSTPYLSSLSHYFATRFCRNDYIITLQLVVDAYFGWLVCIVAFTYCINRDLPFF